MKVLVRLFAILRESAGRSSLELNLPDGATVADALERLSDEPGLASPLASMHLAVAVNRDYATQGTTLCDGDELALVPPVSGGAPRAAGAPHVRITESRLSPESVADSVITDGTGAIVTFQGVTREVDRLDYEAYREMAEERIRAILSECIRAHGLQAAAAEHRIGTVPLGEASVVVSVSSAHRDAAFAAAREAIDRIKSEVPIWKRELDGSKARWVEGSPAPQAAPLQRRERA
jgi:MoaE-MoaD fusion protein